MSSSRRTFLSQMSSMTALGLLAGIPADRIWTLTANDVAATADDATLRKLAAVVIDVARSGGASFADVRIASGRRSNIYGGVNWPPGQRPNIRWMGITTTSQCGVRVIVDGAWGFAASTEMTADGVAAVTKVALARARANKPRTPSGLELAPAPRVDNGVWSSPVAQDPFAVPMGDQAELILAALGEIEKVKDLDGSGITFRWNQYAKVFASSEGSVITQHFTLADSRGDTRTLWKEGWTMEDGHIPVWRGQYGYEAVSHLDLPAEMRKMGEEAVARMRPRANRVMIPTEVGRYDLVLDAKPMCVILGDTLGEALNLELALGYNANGGGTSFIAPPEEMLGKYHVGAPNVTVVADRTRPHAWQTCGWDDEGVKTGEHVVVKDGVVVDYFTGRESSADVGAPMLSRGSRRAQGHVMGAGNMRPVVWKPNLTLLPGKEQRTVADLIAETKRGFYVEELMTGGSDQQLASVQYVANADKVRQITNGKLGDYVMDFAFQATTSRFWKSVAAVGGPESVGAFDMEPGFAPETRNFRRNEALQLPEMSMRAVPARVREMNVMNTGRTA